MMKLNTLFVSFLLCLSTPCFAANLEDVYTDENGVTYTVNLDNIHDIGDFFYQLKEAGYTKHRKNGENLDEHFISLSLTYLYDCGSNQQKFLYGTPRRVKGTGVNESFWHNGRYNYHTWHKVEKESDKKVLQAVCQYSKTNPQKP